MRKILVVCHANKFRSPLAAAVLNSYLHTSVKSAAVMPKFRPGPAGKKMRDMAQELGYDLSAHRAQALTPDLWRWADRIVYMDSGNLRNLHAFKVGFHDPNMTHPWLVCLARWAGDPDITRIPDPAFMRRDSQDLRETAQLIIMSSHRMAKSMIS